MTQQLKFKGTALFDGQKILSGDKVLILSEDRTIMDIVSADLAGEGVQEVDGILSPGFVNTHCHLELSHMKGIIPEGTGLPAFLTQVMEKRGQQDDAVIKTAEEAMWESGISAVGDICNGTATLAPKQHSPIYYHSFVETMGFVPVAAQSRLDYSLSVLEQFRRLNGDMHSCSVVPHAPYSVSKALFSLLSVIPDNTPISIHNQETAAENQLYADKTGAFLDFYQHFGMDASAFVPTGGTSLPAWLPYFKHLPVILVHNTFSTKEDVVFTKQHAPDAYWCLCPQANLYIEKRLPDISLLRSEGCAITLGTDSLASNHQLSIWEEIQAIRGHYPEIPLEEILQWATLNGAKALGISARYGSFEKGKQPGVIVITDKGSRRIY
ncbi:amidohydrolase family protein [Chitinophaga sp. LS1]|uniref:amidohydrolase family protein n=1 Tax=Chitinophaga sp. LS1 TaxID=3051176 RepID=UPI002AAC08CE|nr:amidohydrolase family protein [Chitinophaga sp. LS1]WPV68402.1 amidohydrolase family protein [Chitinophaga sp. LS1]